MGKEKIPLNIFSIPFGLAGLAGCWVTASEQNHVPVWVGNMILIITAIVWLLAVAAYLRYALSGPGRLMADLTDNIAGPFASLAVITPMLLAAQGLFPYAPTAGKVLVDIFVVLTVVLGGWFTGQWIYGPLDIDRLHPGYFLPTVAGGLVAAEATARVGQFRVAEALLGLGVLCWFVLGSMIMGRLFFRPALPPALLPTVAIEMAPPTVGSIAYFAINGDRVDSIAAFLAGYAVLMVLAQVRLLPAYLRLPFGPGTWAFAFSSAAVVTTALHWNGLQRPGGYTAYAFILLAAISAFIAWVAARTIQELMRNQFLPHTP
ncbi:dicarboxylate transporter/tellurite-resistance protein TehA [Streptomyces camponoticapitis]|uniref:Dicarboxylate transporter/tellurite-resistance protein TehA n=1 Tax=Streptomyces camponoticapitis TaxID=1616125 RepID=A0ABQ2E802_9ACTN|nr:TDT family transporter [Streptomyces camponoticapitis]GGK00172.1 dicarboxylate transporter/tellurite-resistance protein TehA [Streptomyces camponoticapitis]